MSVTTHANVVANRQSIWRCTVRPGLFKVVKVNPTNIKLANTVTGQILNAHPSFLVLADGVLDDAPVDTTTATGLGAANDPIHNVTEVPYIPAHNPGTVVRFTSTTPKTPKGLWVVIRDSTSRAGTPTYSVHQLGGSTLYYRGVAHAHLAVVTPAEIAHYL